LISEKYEHYYDDLENFARKGKTTNRPRSKKRQVNLNTKEAFVISVARGRYILNNGLIGRTAREVGAKKIVVGDKIKYIPAAYVNTGDRLVQIIQIKSRETILQRQTGANAVNIKTIAANFASVLILESLDNRKYSKDFFQQIINSLQGQKFCQTDIKIIIGITKCDLEDKYLIKEKIKKDFPNFPIFLFAKDKDLPFSPDSATVFIGRSGVGKSSLLNRYVSGAQQKIGEVNQTTNQGRHTTSAVRAFPYKKTWLIDTPGIRSFRSI
jgi:ribosome small subunit-dependent GTPase A